MKKECFEGRVSGAFDLCGFRWDHLAMDRGKPSVRSCGTPSRSDVSFKGPFGRNRHASILLSPALSGAALLGSALWK